MHHSTSLINLHIINTIRQIQLRYYPFAVNLDGYIGSCNTLNDVSNKLCAPNKTEDLCSSVFNMTAIINESKKLTKHISCECICRSNGRKWNSNQKWNYDKCQYELRNQKKNDACGKDYVFEIYFIKYIRRFIDDSAVKLDETIDTKKYIPTNFDERR